jgi:hypothetical protein
MVYYVLTGDERGPRQAQTIPEWSPPGTVPPERLIPPTATSVGFPDFVHRPAVFGIRSYGVARRVRDALGKTASVSVYNYGTDCFTSSSTARRRTLHHQPPVRRRRRCSRVSDVNKSGLDYNRVNCKRPEYVVVQERTDARGRLPQRDVLIQSPG